MFLLQFHPRTELLENFMIFEGCIPASMICSHLEKAMVIFYFILVYKVIKLQYPHQQIKSNFKNLSLLIAAKAIFMNLNCSIE